MGEKVIIKDLEHLVSWITTNHYWAMTKWKLESYSSKEWDNEEEGAAWQAKLEALEVEYPRFSDRNDKYYEKRTALYDSIPDQHLVYVWTLTEAGSGWHAQYIELPAELGAQIDAIWTKREGRWSSQPERVGLLSIPGMLKRLGNTEVGERIKAQKETERLASEMRSRNYARKELRRLAMEIEKHLATLGIDNRISVQRLLEIEDEH